MHGATIKIKTRAYFDGNDTTKKTDATESCIVLVIVVKGAQVKKPDTLCEC